MHHTDLEKRIEAELRGMREELRALKETRQPQPEPYMYSIPDAAVALGIGTTKLRALIASKEVLTRSLGGRKMVPRSEMRRLGELEYQRKTAAAKSTPRPAKKIEKYDSAAMEEFLKKPPKS